MATIRRIPVGGCGPEDVALDETGALVTGVADGRVLRVGANGSITTLGSTGGRPLGIELLPDGRLVVCDAERGLLALDPAGGSLECLVDGGPDGTVRLCDNATVAREGTIYFTDSSSRYGLDRYQADVLERTATGRLMRREPGGALEEIATGLQFANGVTLALDESFVLVAESGAARITRIQLTGEPAGSRAVFAEGLPGLPDNLSTGADGTIWAALPRPNPRAIRWIQHSPLTVRRAVGRAVSRLDLPPPPGVRVLGFDRIGRRVCDIDERDAGYRMVTGVRAQGNTLYLGSLYESAVAVCRLFTDPAPAPACRQQIQTKET